MKICWLFDRMQNMDFGEQYLQNRTSVKQFKCFERIFAAEHQIKFLTDAFRSDF